MGHEAVVEPLLGIERLSPALPAFDALAFTSANGVRAFAALSDRRDVPAWCVGARTAEAARAVGFASVRSADGDVEALAEAMIAGLPADARILHAATESPAGDLAGRLAKAGLRAHHAAVYRAVETAAPGPALGAHLGGNRQLSAILVHSPAAGRVLARLAAGSGAPLDIAAISLNAAAPLRDAARRVEIASHPNEDSLLLALERLLGQATDV